MKSTLIYILLLLMFVTLLFLPNSFAQNPPSEQMVQIIYFVPRDRQPQPGVNDKLDKVMKEAQEYFADEMGQHGFGRKTFRYETDAQGKAIVSRLTGLDDEEHYTYGLIRVQYEMSRRGFDFSRNTYFIVIEFSDEALNSALNIGFIHCGIGGNRGETGFVIIAGSGGHCFTEDYGYLLAAHELAHAFGLHHDFSEDTYLMSYAPSEIKKLSRCDAEWLNISPFFNSTPKNRVNNDAVIQMTGSHISPPFSVRLQFKTIDLDGLQWAHLLTDATAPDEGPGFPKLIGCKELEGQHQTFEFVTSELLKKSEEITLQVIDRYGNIAQKSFPIDISALSSGTDEEGKIVGPWLWMIAPSGRGGTSSTDVDALAAVSNGTVTEADIAKNGAKSGDSVGNYTWTSADIRNDDLEYSADNVTEIVNRLGWAAGNIDYHSSYALITLESSDEQRNVFMQVGSDDSIKVWLNGEVVHNNPVNRSSGGFQDTFRVNLRRGDNLLLVKVVEFTGKWSMYVGVDADVRVKSHEPVEIPERVLTGDINIDEQGRITGPWLWMIASTAPHPGGAPATNIDSLAAVSSGTVTETDIAKNGANPGDSVGKYEWTLADIHYNIPDSDRLSDNITDLVHQLGWDTRSYIDNHSSYALITLESPTAQKNVGMRVGSDDSIKVWLNGEVVHNIAVNRGTSGFQETFQVNLRRGDNLLLVKVSQASGNWSMFVGIDAVIGKPATPEETDKQQLTNRPEAPIYTSPSPVQSPDIGERLTFNLNIAKGQRVAGYQATAQFDTTALRYVSSANGDYLPPGAFFSKPVVEGNTVKINAASLAGEANGDGTLATFTFEVIAVKASTLTLSNVLLSNSAGEISRPQVKSAEITASRQFRADVNRDGTVSILDLVAVAAAFGETGQTPADVNGDGSVSILDLVAVAAAFGTDAAAPSLDLESYELLTATDVKQWLSQVQGLTLSDMTSRSGILFLEQLLLALLPKETVLLPNYPNPFNPETWIPYQLSSPADVTVHIYSINGSMIRHLPLGYQAAGIYHGKSRAAYWDGKNELGEPVASGVYFYTLSAGDFVATRKMLIRK